MTVATVARKKLEALGQEALDALARGRPDQARAPLDRLTAILPDHPNVMYLRRWAAMLAFDWPAARAPAEPAARPAPDGLDLVIFHVDLPAAPSGQHEAVDYMRMAALSFEAMALRAPGAQRILLTDARTHVPDGIGAHRVIRAPMDAARPMYERMRAEVEFLAARPAGRATVFMDADVVTNRDPAAIFAEDFDVGLTWRPELPDSPFNGGLIFVGPGAAGTVFFEGALRCYDALAADAHVAALFERDLRAWWGDQFALAALVGYRAFAERHDDWLTVDGARIRFFPAAEYNFTPEQGRHYADDFLAGRHFVHFKGNRKAMQPRFLERLRGAAAAG